MAQCRDQGTQGWDGDDQGFLWYTTERGTEIMLTDVGDLSDALDLIDSLASICWEEWDLLSADGEL